MAAPKQVNIMSNTSDNQLVNFNKPRSIKFDKSISSAVSDDFIEIFGYSSDKSGVVLLWDRFRFHVSVGFSFLDRSKEFFQVLHSTKNRMRNVDSNFDGKCRRQTYEKASFKTNLFPLASRTATRGLSSLTYSKPNSFSSCWKSSLLLMANLKSSAKDLATLRIRLRQ